MRNVKAIPIPNEGMLFGFIEKQPSLGMGMVGYGSCMAMLAASPSSIMEAAFGRLYTSGAGAFGARLTLVESILLDGEAANIAIQDPYPTIPIPNEGCFSIKPNSMPSVGMGMGFTFLTYIAVLTLP